jgi:hypothetical protein
VRTVLNYLLLQAISKASPAVEETMAAQATK